MGNLLFLLACRINGKIQVVRDKVLYGSVKVDIGVYGEGNVYEVGRRS